jgi:inorganic pyrophosphatase
MGLSKLNAGNKVPEDINVVIEIPSRSSPIKYEMDKTSGMIKVDRFLTTAMEYPCEYGFIPNTLSEDGDPVDVLVLSPFPLMPGVVINCRPIGLLRMEDESGKDAKILAVPSAKLTPAYQHIQKIADLDKHLLDKIEHFFSHYKDLEPGKWSKVAGFEELASAQKEIEEGVKRG